MTKLWYLLSGKEPCTGNQTPLFRTCNTKWNRDSGFCPSKRRVEGMDKPEIGLFAAMDDAFQCLMYSTPDRFNILSDLRAVQ